MDGVDSGICDNGCAVAANQADVGDWFTRLEKMKKGEVQLSQGEACQQMYLYPKCLFMPDHAHMIFDGCLKTGVTAQVEWKELDRSLHAISHLLSHAGLVQRVSFICFRGNDQAMASLKRYVGDSTILETSFEVLKTMRT